MPGDVLFSWQGDPSAAGFPASGELVLPFDLVEVFIEQVPRNQVTLHGRRGAEAKAWVLPQGAPSAWQEVRTVPVLEGDLLLLYQRGREQLRATDFEAGTATLRSAATLTKSDRSEDLAVWLLAIAAQDLAKNHQWGQADAFYAEAVAWNAATGEPFVAAQLLREWGSLFQDRRAWWQAEECFERALAADRKKPFESLAEAWSLAGLGSTDNRSRGPKDDGALFQQVLEIRHRLAPGSADDALGWMHLADAAARGGDWAKAAESYDRAVRMLENLETGRLLLAEALSNLGYVQMERGEDAVAEGFLLRSHSLLREAPNSFLMAGVAQSLGLIAAKKGELQEAEKHLAESLEVCRQSVPGSLYEADALRELGLFQLQAGKSEAASRHLCQALDRVETWRQRFRSHEEVRSRWSLSYADFYRDCAESLLDTRPADAFLAIEKGRARAFLDLRAERGFRLATLSAERGRQWQKLNAEYERAQEELDAAVARKEAVGRIVNLEGRLREVRRSKERLLAQDRPPGSLPYPEPLSLSEARRRLEPGTSLLLYSVGARKTALFVLSPEGGAQGGAPGWTALTLPVGGAELARRIGFFRGTLVKERLNQRALAAQSRALYDLLVRPAEPYLGNAERLVISPDGPLHTLPFAALLRGDGRYLVEWKPLHFTLSATAYAEQLSQRPASGAAVNAPAAPTKLVAFGDPLYSPPKPDADPLATEIIARRGVVPLPATRREVEGIARLFAGGRAVVGAHVTEETVKEAAGGASLIHFAVHGVLNERQPLNSALVLSPSQRPGKRSANGLLQAWEVMEGLPLAADLVTLSACDTALGQDAGGEGLIGLTRAFQYAGARSVLATLWGISDRSTSDFMLHLYGALRVGKSKDEALRAAQLAQIRSAKPQPFYWAAFQLFGDWR